MRDKIRTDKVMRKVKRQSDAFNAAKAKRKEVSAGTERAKNFLGQAKAKKAISTSRKASIFQKLKNKFKFKGGGGGFVGRALVKDSSKGGGTKIK